jgi:hypothetical protein
MKCKQTYQVEPSTEALSEDLLGHLFVLLAEATAEHVIATAAQLPHASYIRIRWLIIQTLDREKRLIFSFAILTGRLWFLIGDDLGQQVLPCTLVIVIIHVHVVLWCVVIVIILRCYGKCNRRWQMH